jgi:hypothetical protein
MEGLLSQPSAFYFDDRAILVARSGDRIDRRPEDIKEVAEGSLKRRKTEVIDLFYLTGLIRTCRLKTWLVC